MWFDERRLGAGQERRSVTATAIHRILSPVDFSESSRRALEYALDLARRRGAEVTVVHVAARTLPPLSALAAYAGAALEGNVRERLRRDLLEELRRFVEPAAQDVRVKYAVEEGNVVGSIVEMAGRSDLLVLGTHGHGEVEGVILGSVAEKALHRAPCPVLTVPRAAVAGAGASATFEHIQRPRQVRPGAGHRYGEGDEQAQRVGRVVGRVIDEHARGHDGARNGPPLESLGHEHAAAEAGRRQGLIDEELGQAQLVDRAERYAASRGPRGAAEDLPLRHVCGRLQPHGEHEPRGIRMLSQLQEMCRPSETWRAATITTARIEAPKIHETQAALRRANPLLPTGLPEPDMSGKPIATAREFR